MDVWCYTSASYMYTWDNERIKCPQNDLSFYSSNRLSHPTEDTHSIVNDNQSRESPPRVKGTSGRQGCQTATVEEPSRRDGNVGGTSGVDLLLFKISDLT